MKNAARSKSGISKLLTAGIIIVGGYIIRQAVLPKIKERLQR